MISLAKFLLICYWMTIGGIAREVLWTNKEFSPVDIIPPWFSMLIYHLRAKKRPVNGRSSET
jgi:hypothetical protein